MKKLMLLAIAIFALQTNSIAQETKQEGPNFPKIDASPMDLVIYRNADDKAIARVIYSRPQKRNREVFGKLVPFGEVWRTYANEATELTLYQDMKVADETVKAGTYTIYTIPNEKEWTIILNNRIHTWGAYEYTDKEDLVRIKVLIRNSPTSIESFSMAFEPNENGANLLMGWDDKYVSVPFKATGK
ncbi:DUF2911 domain-containing protein [Antarcticibacterium sp. 1MA-6-2]|uniref:DUF2911 domain-containing protein n=1 Tax=Antarcticibacterium sp. 1MA-6-2 TaxID=2908210 RepID=UPI001F3EB66A|nr:DUF2911 domain-containing protein [Antarcticibacterium sp. 1MA-6-2]UJH89702.1 DUF2911 domain-containing protein [Antarcticibacterium sp. 1MA-6-2]